MACTSLNTFHKLRSAVTRHRAVADTTRELEQSSDRALAEMGIARGDIASLAGRALPRQDDRQASAPSGGRSSGK